jgi:hypothetical protein
VSSRERGTNQCRRGDAGYSESSEFDDVLRRNGGLRREIETVWKRPECGNLGEKERRRRGIWGRVGEAVARSGRKGGRAMGNGVGFQERKGAVRGRRRFLQAAPACRKKKKERGRGAGPIRAAGLALTLLGSGRGPVGCCSPFFLFLFFFPFSALVSLLFLKIKNIFKTNF